MVVSSFIAAETSQARAVRFSRQITLLDRFLPKLEQADTGERFLYVISELERMAGGCDTFSQRDVERLSRLSVPCRVHGPCECVAKCECVVKKPAREVCSQCAL